MFDWPGNFSWRYVKFELLRYKEMAVNAHGAQHQRQNMMPLPISESRFASWEYLRVVIKTIFRFILIDENIKEPPMT